MWLSWKISRASAPFHGGAAGFHPETTNGCSSQSEVGIHVMGYFSGESVPYRVFRALKISNTC